VLQASLPIPFDSNRYGAHLAVHHHKTNWFFLSNFEPPGYIADSYRGGQLYAHCGWAGGDCHRPDPAPLTLAYSRQFDPSRPAQSDCLAYSRLQPAFVRSWLSPDGAVFSRNPAFQNLKTTSRASTTISLPAINCAAVTSTTSWIGRPGCESAGGFTLSNPYRFISSALGRVPPFSPSIIQ